MPNYELRVQDSADSASEADRLGANGKEVDLEAGLSGGPDAGPDMTQFFQEVIP